MPSDLMLLRGLLMHIMLTVAYAAVYARCRWHNMPQKTMYATTMREAREWPCQATAGKEGRGNCRECSRAKCLPGLRGVRLIGDEHPQSNESAACGSCNCEKNEWTASCGKRSHGPTMSCDAYNS
jgi:hypothetical protein